MINSDYVFRFITVSVFTGITDAVLNRVGTISGGETIVDIVSICGVVIDPHRASVVVLVKTSCIILDCQAMMHDYFMIGVTASHLKAVAVTLTRILGQTDGNRIAVTVGHLRTYLTVKPCLIHPCCPRI